MGQRRRRRTRRAAGRIWFPPKRNPRSPPLTNAELVQLRHSRDRAGEFGDRVARRCVRTAARSCPRNGSLHRAQAGLHPSPSDGSCRRSDDRPCRKSRSFPKPDVVLTVPPASPSPDASPRTSALVRRIPADDAHRGPASLVSIAMNAAASAGRRGLRGDGAAIDRRQRAARRQRRHETMPGVERISVACVQPMGRRLFEAASARMAVAPLGAGRSRSASGVPDAEIAHHLGEVDAGGRLLGIGKMDRVGFEQGRAQLAGVADRGRRDRRCAPRRRSARRRYPSPTAPRRGRRAPARRSARGSGS